MIRQHSGHIVNTPFIFGLVASPEAANYTATKHAVVAVSKTLRLEAERHGVQVSVLCPGVIRTPILTGGQYGRINITGVSDEELLKFFERMRPMATERFAERALRAVSREDAIIVVPAWWKAWWYLEQLSPALSMLAAKVLLLKRLRKMESTVS
jgi:short-subunit dehydrogenase